MLRTVSVQCWKDVELKWTKGFKETELLYTWDDLRNPCPITGLPFKWLNISLRIFLGMHLTDVSASMFSLCARIVINMADSGKFPGLVNSTQLPLALLLRSYPRVGFINPPRGAYLSLSQTVCHTVDYKAEAKDKGVTGSSSGRWWSKTKQTWRKTWMPPSAEVHLV